MLILKFLSLTDCVQTSLITTDLSIVSPKLENVDRFRVQVSEWRTLTS